MLKYIIGLLGLFILASCQNSTPTEPKPEPQPAHEEHGDAIMLDSTQRLKVGIQTGSFTPQNIKATLKASGYLIASPTSRATASSLTAGIIQQVYVKHGQTVSKGQLLIKIQSPALVDLQKQYLNIYNQLQMSQNELKRQRLLMSDSATSGKNYDMAAIEVANLERNLSLLGAELAIYELNPSEIIAGRLQTTYNVQSPISGQVQEVNINLGGRVEAHSPLLTLLNNQQLEADLLVFERNAAQVQIGQTVLFDYQNKTYQARVVAINKELESKDRSLRIHAELSSKEPSLYAGTYIEGRIELSEQKTPCLPSEAIANQNGLSYIFIEEKHEGDFEYTAIPVLLGTREGDWVEVSPTMDIPADAAIVTKGAFYIMAQGAKSSAAHEH